MRAPAMSNEWPKNFSNGANSSMSWLRMDCAPDRYRFSAKKIDQVPSVVMNGGSLTLVMNQPFNMPAATPPARPTTMPIGVGTPISMDSLPMITDINTMIAATDRSIPAVIMIIDWAAARMPMIETCCMISDRLKAEKKRPPAINPNTIRLSARTMTGTSVGLLCRMCWIC